MLEHLHLFELPIMQQIQSIRSPALDFFFRILDFFDREAFALIALPLIWFGISRKWGVRFFFILALSIFINNFLKDVFSEPRPFELWPELAVITRKGFGFPSGASQNSVIVLGMLSYMIRKPFFYWIAGFFMILMGFSRIYLGVHFPSDVIVGWTVGVLLLVPYCLTIKKMERFFSKQPYRKLMIFSIALPLSLLLLNHSLISLSIVSMIIGVSIGLTFIHFNTRSFEKNLSLMQKSLLAATTVFGIALLFVITKGLLMTTSLFSVNALLTFLGYFFMGIWLSVGSTAIFYQYCYPTKE